MSIKIYPWCASVPYMYRPQANDPCLSDIFYFIYRFSDLPLPSFQHCSGLLRHMQCPCFCPPAWSHSCFDVGPERLYSAISFHISPPPEKQKTGDILYFIYTHTLSDIYICVFTYIYKCMKKDIKNAKSSIQKLSIQKLGNVRLNFSRHP